MEHIHITEYLKFHSVVKIKEKCNRTARPNLDILMAYLRGRNKSNVFSQFSGADIYMESHSSVTVIYSMGCFFFFFFVSSVSAMFFYQHYYSVVTFHTIFHSLTISGVCGKYIYIYIYIYIYVTGKLCSNLLYYQ
jgi:hypothetical protein